MDPYDLSAWNIQNPNQQYPPYNVAPGSYPGGFDISSAPGYSAGDFGMPGFGSGPSGIGSGASSFGGGASVGFDLSNNRNQPYSTGSNLNAYPPYNPNSGSDYRIQQNPPIYDEIASFPPSGLPRPSFDPGFDSGIPMGQSPSFSSQPVPNYSSRPPSVPVAPTRGFHDSFFDTDRVASYGEFRGPSGSKVPYDSYAPSAPRNIGYPSVGELRDSLKPYNEISDPFASRNMSPEMPFGYAQRAPHEDIYEPTIKPAPNFNCEDDCERLKKAMHGLGTDEKVLIEIMGGRSSDQRAQIVSKYKSLFGKSLIDKLKSETSRHFKDTLEALCYSMTEYDARELRRAVEGAGTDEDALVEILCTRTNKQLRDIKQCYSEIFKGRDLERDIINDTSRHFKRLLVAILQANRDESLTFDRNAARRDAEDLYRAGEKKLGTDESRFIAILGSRSYAHLRGVFEEYEKISKKTMEAALKSEMHGDLEKAVLAIVGSIKNKPKFFATKLIKAMKGAGTDDHTLIRIIVSRSEIDLGRIKKEFLRENSKTLEAWVHDDTTGDYRRLLLALVNGNCSQ